MRPIKVYVLEAILNKELNGKTHTYVNVNLQGSDNKLATTSVFCNAILTQRRTGTLSGISLFRL